MANEDNQADRERRRRRQKDRVQDDSRLPGPDASETITPYYFGGSEDGRVRGIGAAKEDYTETDRMGLRRALHLHSCDWETDERGFIRPRDRRNYRYDRLQNHPLRPLAHSLGLIAIGACMGAIVGLGIRLIFG